MCYFKVVLAFVLLLAGLFLIECTEFRSLVLFFPGGFLLGEVFQETK